MIMIERRTRLSHSIFIIRSFFFFFFFSSRRRHTRSYGDWSSDVCSSDLPLTGEIYDADIRFDAGMTRFFRREINEYVNPAGTPWMPWMEEPRKPFLAPWHNRPAEFCDLVGGAVRDAEFAFDLLTARGMDRQGPEANQFVHDYLVEIAAHEVAHTLGLRHNFRASTIHTLQQPQDATLTAKEGLTGSVMDYIPTNISTEGQKQGRYHQTTLGPYDYWAIEYAYKPIAANTPDEELPELAKIASRAAEPQLAYDTDEERRNRRRAL